MSDATPKRSASRHSGSSRRSRDGSFNYSDDEDSDRQSRCSSRRAVSMSSSYCASRAGSRRRGSRPGTPRRTSVMADDLVDQLEAQLLAAFWGPQREWTREQQCTAWRQPQDALCLYSRQHSVPDYLGVQARRDEPMAAAASALRPPAAGAAEPVFDAAHCFSNCCAAEFKRARPLVLSLRREYQSRTRRAKRALAELRVQLNLQRRDQAQRYEYEKRLQEEWKAEAQCADDVDGFQ